MCACRAGSAGADSRLLRRAGNVRSRVAHQVRQLVESFSQTVRVRRPGRWPEAVTLSAGSKNAAILACALMRFAFRSGRYASKSSFDPHARRQIHRHDLTANAQALKWGVDTVVIKTGVAIRRIGDHEKIKVAVRRVPTGSAASEQPNLCWVEFRDQPLDHRCKRLAFRCERALIGNAGVRLWVRSGAVRAHDGF